MSDRLVAQVTEWNRCNPKGTAVDVRRDDRTVFRTHTKSGAELLSGHTPVIFLEGVRGAYLLDRVTPAPADSCLICGAENCPHTSDCPNREAMSDISRGSLERDLAFSRGVLAALAHVAAHDNGVIYDEIVRGCGRRQLVAAAQGEDFDLEHLRKYGWVTRTGRLKRIHR